MDTNLSETIDNTTLAARYDASVKEILADKQVLARILKYTLEECADLEIDDIILNISNPEIAKVNVDAVKKELLTKVPMEAQEDYSFWEGKIYFDIRFIYYLKQNELIKILVNIEAQKSTDPGKLGYHLDNRILYYLARMVSSQKHEEFTGSDYDNLKAVRSIWICIAMSTWDLYFRSLRAMHAMYLARNAVFSISRSSTLYGFSQ